MPRTNGSASTARRNPKLLKHIELMPSEHQAPTDVVDSVSCPQCMTRFRLKPQQLSAAGGLVRCGVCMSIFNAATASTPEAHLSAAEPQQIAPEPAETSHAESDATADSPLDLIAGLSTLNHDFEHHHPRHQPRRWPWLIANFIALLVLAGQVALWQKDAVFASPAGDYLQQLCPLHPLLCENKAPEARQLGDVVSTHLLVRKHPSVANAWRLYTSPSPRDLSTSPMPSSA